MTLEQGGLSSFMWATLTSVVKMATVGHFASKLRSGASVTLGIEGRFRPVFFCLSVQCCFVKCLVKQLPQPFEGWFLKRFLMACLCGFLARV